MIDKKQTKIDYTLIQHSFLTNGNNDWLKSYNKPLLTRRVDVLIALVDQQRKIKTSNLMYEYIYTTDIIL